MDPALLTLSLLGGFASFLSPCSFPLLPAYIAYWVGSVRETHAKNALKAGLISGLTIILGIETTLVAVILLPSQLIQTLIPAIPMVTGGVGLLLIALGLLTLMGGVSTLPIRLGVAKFRGIRNPYVQKYLYGVVYAFNSLACVFPILLMILASPLAGGEPLILFLLFSAGIAIPMLMLTVSLALLGDTLARKFRKTLPYVKWVEGTVALAAGLYLLYVSLAH